MRFHLFTLVRVRYHRAGGSHMEIIDEGLPVRPVQNIEGQFLTIKVGRGSEAGIVALTRTEAFRLSLKPWLRDSWKEIGVAPYALATDYLGFRQYLYGAVTGGGSDEEITIKMAWIKQRYLRWMKEMRSEPLITDICREVCHNTSSFRELAKIHGRCPRSVKALFLKGLEEYSRINRMDRKYMR